MAPDRNDLQHLVIVGNGMAGHRLCAKLVEAGAHRSLRIVVFGAERRAAYDRVHLTQLLGDAGPDDLALAAPGWYAEHGIELLLGDPATAIDREEGVVRSASGRAVPFDRLILATGSRPALPAIPGIDAAGVYACRTVDDIAGIRAAAAAGGTAVVLGGGLIGLEAAAAARELGLRVHLLHSGAHLMSRQLGALEAEVLRDRIEALGIVVHTGAAAGSIDGSWPRLAVQLPGPVTLACSLVIVATGVRPCGELAAACGLAMAPGGAVVVDARMATSDPAIFAVGECASHRGDTFALAAPAFAMVDVVVDGLLGGDARFAPADTSIRLELPGAPVAVLGRAHEGASGSSIVHRAGASLRRLVLDDGKLVGFVAVGDCDELDEIAELVRDQRRLSIFHLRRFRTTGRLWPGAPATPVRSWPDETLVCTCLAVTRGMLSEQLRAGCLDAEALAAATGAGTMCGSCRPLLADLCGPGGEARARPATRVTTFPGWPAPIPPPPPVEPTAPRRTTLRQFQAITVEPAVRRRVTGNLRRVTGPTSRASPLLATLSVLSFVVVALFLVAQTSVAQAARAGLHRLTAPDHRTFAFGSGLVALGLMVLGLALSLRRRWRRFASPRVRTFHAAINLAALLALAGHVELSTGRSLAAALLLTTALTSLAGGAAGWIFSGVTALRPKTASATQRAFVLVHLVVAIPMLGLLVSHALGAIYYLGLP